MRLISVLVRIVVLVKLRGPQSKDANKISSEEGEPPNVLYFLPDVPMTDESHGKYIVVGL